MTHRLRVGLSANVVITIEFDPPTRYVFAVVDKDLSRRDDDDDVDGQLAKHRCKATSCTVVRASRFVRCRPDHRGAHRE